jgi:hypothetical protein
VPLMLLINIATMYQVLSIAHILYVPYRITIVQSIYIVQGFPFALACTYIICGHKDVYNFCKSNFLKLLLGGWIGNIGIHEFWKILNYKITKMLLDTR